MFTETASGARTDRLTLTLVLDQLRPGDTPVVWSSTASAAPCGTWSTPSPAWPTAGSGSAACREAIDTTTPGGKLVFHVFAALAETVATLGVSQASIYRHVGGASG